ncbi:MAG TPA: acyl carrier protein [Thermoanaerobaculia bacterium]
MQEESFVSKLRELVGSEPADESAIHPKEWDSVDVLDLIASIDESFDVTVPVNELNECSTVGELRALIRSVGGAA